MPYTQNWGISRNAFQSPLNDNEIDTDPNADEDIIEQNNRVAESTAVNIPKFIPREKIQRPEFPTDGSDEEKKEWYSKYNEGDAITEASEENTRALTLGLGHASEMNEEEKRVSRGDGNVLDYINMAGTAGGMTPVYGAGADAFNTIFSGGRTVTNFIGDTFRSIKNRDIDYSRTLARAKDTGFALGGIVPIGGQVLNTGKLTKNVIGKSKGWTFLKGLKLGDQITDVAKASGIKGPRLPISTVPTGLSAFTGKMGAKIASWFSN